MRCSKILLIPLLACLPATAQKVNQPLSWHQMTIHSGYIFSGSVTAIEHVAAKTSNDVATMRITFQVEQAILGVHTGQTLVVREWAGLWESPKRYRIGERVLLFLYPPSKLGLTSPVGGSLGRFEIDSKGEIVLDRGRVDPLSPYSFFHRDAPVRGKTRANAGEFARAIRRVIEE
jgi:hypothetical protein